MSNTISRRSLAKGAAWSIPAVVAAGSVPALAASPRRNCEQGPYLQVNTRQSTYRPIRYTSQFGGSPSIGFESVGNDGEPEDYLALPLDVSLVGEFAPGAQAAFTMDLRMIETVVTARDGAGNETTEERRVTSFRGDPVMYAGAMVRGSQPWYPREFRRATHPSWLDAVVSANGTTITITLTNTGTEATGVQSTMFMLFVPLEPLHDLTQRQQMQPPYLRRRIQDQGAQYTVAFADTSGCTYAPTAGVYGP